MDAKTLDGLRQRLQRRRRDLVEIRLASERGAQEVRDGRTDPEYEESAQAEHVEYTLQRLSDSQQAEVTQIDAALARMDAGTYGECIECGNEIEPERLAALPFAVRCAECATRQDEEQAALRSMPTL